MDNYRKSWLRDYSITTTNGDLKLVLLLSLLSQAHVNSACARGRLHHAIAVKKCTMIFTESPLLLIPFLTIVVVKGEQSFWKLPVGLDR